MWWKYSKLIHTHILRLIIKCCNSAIWQIYWIYIVPFCKWKKIASLFFELFTLYFYTKFFIQEKKWAPQYSYRDIIKNTLCTTFFKKELLKINHNNENDTYSSQRQGIFFFKKTCHKSYFILANFLNFRKAFKKQKWECKSQNILKIKKKMFESLKKINYSFFGDLYSHFQNSKKFAILKIFDQFFEKISHL